VPTTFLDTFWTGIADLSTRFGRLTVAPSQVCFPRTFDRSLRAIAIARFDEGAKQWMRFEGLGLEFGVELAAEEEGVAGDFYYLDVGGIGGGSGDS
jgi:hypothetical protein